MKNGQNAFWGTPPPKKKNNFGGRTKICCQKRKKSKLFKITWNGEKIDRKWFLDLLPPPQKKIFWRPYKIFFSKMKKIKVVQNCLKWRENWPKTKKIKVVQNHLKWRENWSKMIFGFVAPPPQKKIKIKNKYICKT